MNPGPGVPSFLLVVLGESVRRIRQFFPLKNNKNCYWMFMDFKIGKTGPRDVHSISRI